MTLPDERYRAIRQSRQFLQDLCDSSKTPRIPTVVRSQARSLLRHYPSDWELDQLAAACPAVLQQRLEAVHDFIVTKQRDIDTHSQ